MNIACRTDAVIFILLLAYTLIQTVLPVTFREVRSSISQFFSQTRIINRFLFAVKTIKNVLLILLWEVF